MGRCKLAGSLGIDVDDVAQPHILHGGDVSGMDRADPAGAELREL
jgi:hypothetical protein